METIKAYKLTVNNTATRYEVDQKKALYLVQRWPNVFKLNKKRVTLRFSHTAKARGQIWRGRRLSSAK